MQHTNTHELDLRVRKVYADQLRNHRRYTGLITKNAQWYNQPFFVSIETLTRCNASCEFCPYPTIERKGEKMSDDLFHKIIDDLAAACVEDIPNFTLNRVSEPFLDVRTFDFARYIVSKFPTAKINRVTNGSVMTDKIINKLIDQGNTGYIKISFNDHRPEHYQRTMKLPFERTYRNVKRLHERLAAGDLNNYVMVGRVGDGSSADADFIDWCRKEFPLFHALVSPRFGWMGYTHSFDSPVLTTQCTQWFQLHFLANGREAHCCIDSTGRFGRGDATVENAYDIYMHPHRKAMRAATARRDVKACKACTALV